LSLAAVGGPCPVGPKVRIRLCASPGWRNLILPCQLSGRRCRILVDSHLSAPEEWVRLKSSTSFLQRLGSSIAPRTGYAGSFMDAARPRRRNRGFLGTLGGLLVCSLLSADSAVPANPRMLALIGGRLLTQTDAGSVVGTVLIRDGTIVAAGPMVTVPP